MVKIKKMSKRQPARLRYKIEKKVRDHNKKQRKLNKKKPPSKKSKLIQVPNICPFKEDILREAEEMKKRKEEEQQKRREQLKLERAQQKKTTLEQMVNNAEVRGQIHTALEVSGVDNQKYGTDKKQENSLKAYYKEFKKVLDAADVILEVVDARDPLGTRCTQVENAIKAAKNKKLVLVLNKADLIPRTNLEKWLKYLKQSVPAVPFKASTQSQSNQLGRRKMAQCKNEKALQGSTCVGAELLMSLLANYCRNNGIKTAIRVGVVGLPNVGKSSLINSLIRSRACNVGATPGVTKAMQEVQLDTKIKLLDSPGIVFADSNKSNDSSIALKNALSIGSLKDPFTPANAILQRADKKMLCNLYDIVEFSTPKEFYALKAARMGKILKGGVPDQAAAARGLLEDWNNGKVRYYTEPPSSEGVHISASIVKQDDVKEFDVDSFQSMECETIGQINCDDQEGILIESTGPVDILEKMDEDDVADDLISSNINVVQQKKKKKLPKKNIETKKTKVEPVLSLVGNQTLNKMKKIEAKKIKKAKLKSAKHAMQLADVLDNVTLKI
ncbi:guanine nucleotide-binding protein-like 3 homolog [Ctenocephalides felis]|uniref:guanine nucleotide-binding protein-like 3 homolog n=1 Tax=Ctenocephalides felis TaxID=7515 RepID=UPI000E6E1E08|nr:guanine nucleotide-binding protein-like 3 homolog [Ctenocephalides felis]